MFSYRFNVIFFLQPLPNWEFILPIQKAYWRAGNRLWHLEQFTSKWCISLVICTILIRIYRPIIYKNYTLFNLSHLAFFSSLITGELASIPSNFPCVVVDRNRKVTLCALPFYIKVKKKDRLNEWQWIIVLKVFFFSNKRRKFIPKPDVMLTTFEETLDI